MRQAFSYVQLLLYLGLAALILATSLPVFFKVNQLAWQSLANVRNTRALSESLDLVAREAAYAEAAAPAATELALTVDGEKYTYTVHNQRFARQKTGWLYLTPKNLVINEFTARWLTPGLLEITLTSPKLSLTRKVQRRN